MKEKVEAYLEAQTISSSGKNGLPSSFWCGFDEALVTFETVPIPDEQFFGQFDLLFENEFSSEHLSSIDE
ncbi:unnamed protein product [Caenorhabditis auriculariae]|uniref:Uncharacterized protein n=1 Tax=Caenorhabditis auriculariae TaxID=2777116 RepID=A0A8S1H4R1_9PELO|nr:unnamed protein product [Caenorhabditis auriculariae]